MQEDDLTIERFVELKDKYKSADKKDKSFRRLEQDLINCAHYLARQKGSVDATHWICNSYAKASCETGLDHAQYQEYLEFAATKNHTPSIYLLARHYAGYSRAISIRQYNMEKAKELMKKAAETGYKPARLDYAYMLHESGTVENVLEAEKYYLALMEEGFIQAFRSYFVSYFLKSNGLHHGKEKEAFEVLTRALAYLDEAAAKEFPVACAQLYYFIGLCHYEGAGCERDPEKSLKYMKKSADIESFGNAYYWMKNRGIKVSKESLKPVKGPKNQVQEQGKDKKTKSKKSKKKQYVTKLESPLCFIPSEKSNSDKKVKALDKDSLTKILEPFDNVIGLEHVKGKIEELFYSLIADQRRSEEGIESKHKPSLHMFFTGNSGSGKTMVARIMGRVFNELGFLSKGHTVEVDRSDLVGPYIGTSEERTSNYIAKAKGGILFIDEAYALNNGSHRDFGLHVINMLVKVMEDSRDDMIVIMAGYPEEMSWLLKSNPGLESRIGLNIHFEDYTDDEKTEIFENFVNQAEFKLQQAAKERLAGILKSMSDNEKEKMGNARGVRNLFEQTLRAQAKRIVEKEITHKTELMTIIADDIPGNWVPPCETNGNVLKLSKKKKR